MSSRWQCVALALLAGNAAGADWFVDRAGPPAGSGSAWTTAFTDLQSALAVAQPGDTIHVAQGIYTPGSSGQTTASFVLRSGVVLLGGYPTGGGMRDPGVYESVLSGDLDQDDSLSGWPTSWSINGRNVEHVVTAPGVDATAVLDGFVVAQGHLGAAGTPAYTWPMFGGGLFILEGSPTIRECEFRYNTAAFGSGGGLYVYRGAPRVERCRFVNNYVHLGSGAGMAAVESAPIIEDSVFQGNLAVSGTVSAGDGSGAGLALYGCEPTTVVGCQFLSNTARSFYGIGDEIGTGGGAWAFFTETVFDRCTFIGNRAAEGAGIRTWDEITITNSLFAENVAVEQPNDPYPDLGGYGAGVAAWTGSGPFSMINCTVVNNHGEKDVGITIFGDGPAEIWNSILYGNEGTALDQGPIRFQVSGTNDLFYSCVEGLFEPPEPGEDPLTPDDVPGSFDVDPSFVDAGAGDFTLAAASPCIDAGDSGAVPGWASLDLNGLARIVDDLDAPDVGVGSPVVDVGAYERQQTSPPCPADLTGEGDVNTNDFFEFLSLYQAQDMRADFSPGGGINTNDFFAFLAAYQAGC